MIEASVVIPAWSAEGVIERQLSSLADQTFTNFEVVIADNGGSDALRTIADRWSDRLDVRVVDATARPGCGPARNVGAAAAKSDLLLFCDADDLVASTWVSAHREGLESHDFCTGPKALVTESDLDEQQASILFDRALFSAQPNTMGSRPYASGGNASYRRATLDAIGGFCSHNLRREDVEASWLALDLGFTLHFASDARILYVQRSAMGARMKQAFVSGVGIEALRRQFGTGVEGVVPMSLSAKRLVGGLRSNVRDTPVALASLLGQLQERAMPGRHFESLRREAQDRVADDVVNDT